jgi:hypothetical protein
MSASSGLQINCAIIWLRPASVIASRGYGHGCEGGYVTGHTGTERAGAWEGTASTQEERAVALRIRVCG